MKRILICALLGLSVIISGCGEESTNGKPSPQPTASGYTISMNDVYNIGFWVQGRPEACQSVLNTYGKLVFPKLEQLGHETARLTRVYVQQLQADCRKHERAAVQTDAALLISFARANGGNPTA